MRRWFTTLRWASFSAVLIAITALAQQAPPSLPIPRLEYMTPNGGKLGTVVELTVFGTDLEEPESLVFSDPRIKAELVPLPPVPAPIPKRRHRPGTTINGGIGGGTDVDYYSFPGRNAFAGSSTNFTGAMDKFFGEYISRGGIKPIDFDYGIGRMTTFEGSFFHPNFFSNSASV